MDPRPRHSSRGGGCHRRRHGHGGVHEPVVEQTPNHVNSSLRQDIAQLAGAVAAPGKFAMVGDDAHDVAFQSVQFEGQIRNGDTEPFRSSG